MDYATPLLAGFLTCIFLHKCPVRGDVALAIHMAILFGCYLIRFFDGYVERWQLLSDPLKTIFLHDSATTLTTIAYRVSPIHPLYRFPGPLIHKITSLQTAYIVYSGRRHLIVAGLHARYGKYVRIGPNTLSINSHVAVSPIYASTVPMDKSRAYQFGDAKGKGLFFMRKVEEHNGRRRQWAGAFSVHSLKEHKITLERRAFELVECIGMRHDGNGVVNLSQCLHHFAYDAMGDIVFGNSSRLDLMKEGDPEGLITSGQSATIAFESLGEVPSLSEILWHLPVTDRLRRLEYYAGKLMTARQNMDSCAEHHDLASHLLCASDPSRQKLPPEDLRADALFAIQAGSDTPAGVLTFLFYFLLSHRDVYDKLREELDDHLSTQGEGFIDGTLDELPYLNAVVNETLRLGTPFGGFPRVVPQGGIVIDDQFIPQDTIVSVPTYTQEISEENFWPEPLSFKPERWLPGGLGPGSRARKSAIMAFSYGPFGCLGKSLAIHELLIVTARLLLNYDLTLSASFDHEAFSAGVYNIRAALFSYPLLVVATRRRG
ncbi:cytochrome P450 monooxygenase 23 [Heterobasidion irregulare TC 32-1]|uniref:Cytochrome P450 monooxygenase 23 n=1 Tax=Heterobasidion irregulare (strain TC 32-1) TaxID=747525 RepID=W4K397_HETIT|nr:cytochrome P450 monooxygenase 23 [Heterobasidion irregulare TC 32-1]ETW79556.1 cytochrome P450 monooxygenase 23 [Heterobasidion irregulare TC 32-1]